MHYTYMLRCKDNSLYTGYTNGLEKRLKVHRQGKGAKYTKTRTPVELVFVKAFETKSEALRKESEIKKLVKKDKEKLIKADGNEINKYFTQNTSLFSNSERDIMNSSQNT